ncbi:MAG: biopolymer transporter ExbD [Gemmataceae bacterium]
MSTAKPPKAFDVWFVAANTVYKAVPYNVVADWTGQGRLGPTDKLRPAGTEAEWKTIAQWPLFADYLPRPSAAKVAEPAASPTPNLAGIPVLSLPEAPEEEALITSRKEAEEDDDVDMIPLIDISMVLLVFFIMVSAAGALSPVDVPEMRYGGELRTDPEAITISIERANAEDVVYSVREGTQPAKKGNDRLQFYKDSLEALDRILTERVRPPEVRVACEKDLPSDRVHELAKELAKRQKDGKINSFVAIVNEAPKQ